MRWIDKMNNGSKFITDRFEYKFKRPDYSLLLIDQDDDCNFNSEMSEDIENDYYTGYMESKLRSWENHSQYNKIWTHYIQKKQFEYGLIPNIFESK